MCCNSRSIIFVNGRMTPKMDNKKLRVKMRRLSNIFQIAIMPGCQLHIQKIENDKSMACLCVKKYGVKGLSRNRREAKRRCAENNRRQSVHHHCGCTAH